jgi:hypothetical protein
MNHAVTKYRPEIQCLVYCKYILHEDMHHEVAQNAVTEYPSSMRVKFYTSTRHQFRIFSIITRSELTLRIRNMKNPNYEA